MDEKERVREHLKVLSVLHYVMAVFGLFGVCVGAFYAGIGGFIAKAMEEQQKRSGESAPGADVVTGVFAFIGVAIIVFSMLWAVGYALSGWWMSARKNRMFSIVVACFSCLHLPLGTLLGVFTLITLSKPEAIELYAEAERGV